MNDEPQYLPWPKDPWNEIVPGLFMGGQICATTPDNVARVAEEFDAVFSFYWRDEDGNGPSDGVPHFHCFIPDGELDPVELETVRRYARNIAALVRAELLVLVRCQAGYNRSGLVVAFALMELGYNVHDAVDLIREKRSPHALHNLAFIRYLMEAAGEAA